ncbi:YdcF family protein [Paenibacillus sp. N4]|uniref:YdcF family protein n=1 Tax=Paenibacillus vietnamensis TaxID=2590547 RepID=UPI001CD112F7|nr:YdcF family protein [Paenibacillus vietnamensis]MCA0757322.1 YdcF family protein [Paenibacillus vietnamensis]
MNFVTIKRFLIVSAGLFIIWFIIHTTFVIIDGLNDELKSVDAAVVLGNKVEVNGQPSERLKARLDRSVELYNRGYFTNIIVSGGIGKEGFDEATVMKSYLIEKGIPEDKIIEDSNGYNSYMTAQNTSKIMNELKIDSVMIITQYFHVSRTKLAFRKMDLDEVYSAHAKIFEFRDIYSIIREFPAYYKYLFK